MTNHDEHDNAPGRKRMTSKDEDSVAGAQDKGAQGLGNSAPRRHFLRVAMSLGVVLVTVGIASVAKSLFAPSTAQKVPPETSIATKTVTKTIGALSTAGGQGSSSSGSQTVSTGSSSQASSSPFPQIVVANISDIAVGQPFPFNYPLQETPNILVKLGQKAEGGIGPDGDIVAFSQFCQHLGCVYGYLEPGASPSCNGSYKAPGPVGYCCCHGSIFDLANAGKVIGGPSPRSVPQVILSFDESSGNISAIGMGPPAIFGHGTGSNDVLDDLQGGTLVSS
jgi:arsenite oxidase small subunit